MDDEKRGAMSGEAQPAVELPDPADFGINVLEEPGLPPELRVLTERVRELVDAVAHTNVDAEELTTASRTVADLTGRLNTRRRDVATMVRRRWPDGRVRYGTLTNIVAGLTNPAAPPLEPVYTTDGVEADITLGGTYQGPPGLVHGGWIAALLDQVLGEAAGAAGVPGLTANLDVNYRRPTPLNSPLRITARVTGTERRKVFVAGEIRHGDEVTAEGTAIIVRIMPLS